MRVLQLQDPTGTGILLWIVEFRYTDTARFALTWV